MIPTRFKIAALATAAAAGAAFAAPAAALEVPGAAHAPMSAASVHMTVPAGDSAAHYRDRRHPSWNRRASYRDDDRGRYRDDRRYYGEPVHRNTRVWRGNDGRYYCRKDDGTTGLLIGAAVGGLIGNEVAGRGDKTLGTVIGAVGGALLGREIDRSNARCR